LKRSSPIVGDAPIEDLLAAVRFAVALDEQWTAALGLVLAPSHHLVLVLVLVLVFVLVPVPGLPPALGRGRALVLGLGRARLSRRLLVRGGHRCRYTRLTRALGRVATVRSALADDIHAPSAPSERRAWSIALALLALGVGMLAVALSGALDSSGVARPGRRSAATAPPAVLAAVPTPGAASASARVRLSGRGAAAGSPYA
jgi:hypothetical protein